VCREALRSVMAASTHPDLRTEGYFTFT